ncbi:MAG: GNAT family N-acetyltransferase [Ferruginibacter sp.]
MSHPVSIQTNNNQHVILNRLTSSDLEHLGIYLNQLSDESKKQFAPHLFDAASILDFYSWPHENIGFVAEDVASTSIIGYAIIKCGYLPHDKPRLEQYGLKPDDIKCATFAPSVADEWQHQGVGEKMLTYILDELKIAGINQVILWGGVRSDNIKAINFYKKAGFKMLGSFEHNGGNYDMILYV